MTGALVILIFTAIVGAALYLLDKRTPEKTPVVEPEKQCCGRHMVCEKTSLTPLTTEIEYFDDEELDRFKDADSSQYSPDEIEEFREILLTMNPEEVPAWARSLQLRSIELPAPVRDELLLIVSELRNNT